MSPGTPAERPLGPAGPGGASAPRRGTGWFPWAVALLVVLHHDFWLWDPPARLVLGLPAGLLYHALYCVAAAALMAVAVRRAWPPPGLGSS